MPLKDGPMPTDAQVDISTASKTDRNTCNKVLCKLGYTNEDNIRYPRLLQEVYGRLKIEENGNGNAAQQRNLYKKLAQCKDNYPEPRDIPSKRDCDPSTTSSSYRPQSNYNPPPKGPKTKNPDPPDEAVKRAEDELVLVRSFINDTFPTEINELYNKIYALDRLASATMDLIWKTNDQAFMKKIKTLWIDLSTITNHASRAKSDKDLKPLFTASHDSYIKFINQYETKQRKNAPKPPKPPKAPKPPKTAKAPKSPKSRKGPKTAKASTPPRSPTPPRKTPTPPPRTPTPPRASSTKKRCPNGTRRNKKTGNCEPK